MAKNTFRDQAAAANEAKRAATELTTAFERLGTAAASAALNVGGAFAGVAASVKLFNPGIVSQFTMELRNLGAAIGSVLEPVIRQATGWFSRLNEQITSLSPATKQLIAAVTALGISFTISRQLVNMLAPAISAMAAIASAAISIVMAKGLALNTVLGGIPLVIGGIVTAITTLLGLGAGLGVFGEAFGGMNSQLKPLADLGKAISNMFRAWVPLFRELAIVAAQALTPVFEAIARGTVIMINFGARLLQTIGSMMMAARIFPGIGAMLYDLGARILNGGGSGGGKTYAAGTPQWMAVDEASRRAQAAAFGSSRVDEQQLGQLQAINNNTTTMIGLLGQNGGSTSGPISGLLGISPETRDAINAFMMAAMGNMRSGVHAMLRPLTQ